MKISERLFLFAKGDAEYESICVVTRCVAYNATYYGRIAWCDEETMCILVDERECVFRLEDVVSYSVTRKAPAPPPDSPN